MVWIVTSHTNPMVCYKPYSTHKQQQVYAHGLACKVCTTGKAQSHIHTASLSLIIHHTRRNAHTDYKTFTKGAVLDSSALKYKGIFKNFDQTSFKKRPKKAQTANPKIVRPTNLKTANLATLGGKYDCRSYWYCYCKQGRSQDFSKGGAEVMEAKALKKKNCLWLE